MGAIVWDGQVSDVSIFPAQFQKSLTAKSRKPETVNFDGPPAALLGFFCRTRTPSGCRKTTEDHGMVGFVPRDQPTNGL